MSYEKEHDCLSCGNTFSGRYCNQCGEKVLEARERTLLYFVSQVVSELFSFESRFWSTLKTVVLSPGRLSFDQAIGRRVVYMKPIALFLVGNLVYFLFPIMDTFNTKLEYQLTMPYSDIANVQSRVEQRVSDSQVSYKLFESRFNDKSEANSKLLLVSLIPLLAPVFALIGWKQRRAFSDHLLFALEYNIFMLFVNTLLVGYLLYAFQAIVSLTGLPGVSITDFHVTSLAAAGAFYFLFRGIRKFYGYSIVVGLVCALGAVLSTFALLFVYRWILLEVTLLAM